MLSLDRAPPMWLGGIQEIWMSSWGWLVSLWGVLPQCRLERSPFDWRGNSVLSQCQGNTQHWWELGGAESARQCWLGWPRTFIALCHSLGSGRPTGVPCPTGQSSIGAPQASEATSSTQRTQKLPQILLRGHYGEVDGTGQNSEIYLENDCSKLKRLTCCQPASEFPFYSLNWGWHWPPLHKGLLWELHK